MMPVLMQNGPGKDYQQKQNENMRSEKGQTAILYIVEVIMELKWHGLDHSTLIWLALKSLIYSGYMI